MVNPIIQEVFEKYVAKFRDLGNGNFGIRNAVLDPNLEILAYDDQVKGTLVFRSEVVKGVYDCLIAATEVADELSSRGFETRINHRYLKGFEQNYAEVLDPDTHEWIQVDVTPWFQKIGHMHKNGGERSRKSFKKGIEFTTDTKSAQFISMRTENDGSFVDAYLAAGHLCLDQQIDELSRRKNVGSNNGETTSNSATSPQYTLNLFVKHYTSEEVLSYVSIAYEIMDSAKVPMLLFGNPKDALESLVESGVARVRVEGYCDYCFNQGVYLSGINAPLHGGTSLRFLDEIRSRGDTTQAALDWLEYHIPVLANVVPRLRPKMRTINGMMMWDGHRFRAESLNRLEYIEHRLGDTEECPYKDKMLFDRFKKIIYSLTKGGSSLIK